MAQCEDYDSECFTSDEEFEDNVVPAKQEKLKGRVDEYITASKLGRLAYAAGDVQLAKDRFNLALSLELETELDSHIDFGVTGGLLREELHDRSKEMDESLPVPRTVQRDRMSTILTKLERIYETADKEVSSNPSDPKWYLVMGSSLCVVNEWEKAEKVYMEGISACPNNKELLGALERLNKLKHMMSVLGDKVSDISSYSTLRLHSPKMKRPSSSHAGGSVDRSKVPRSFSFSVDAEVKLRSKRQSLVATNSSVPSTPQPSVYPLSPSSKRKSSLLQFLKRGSGSRPKSQLGNISLSWSSEDLAALDQWEDRSSWSSAFSPTISGPSSLDTFDSCTLQTMRLINNTVGKDNSI